MSTYPKFYISNLEPIVIDLLLDQLLLVLPAIIINKYEE
jgi:hypothetical protein